MVAPFTAARIGLWLTVSEARVRARLSVTLERMTPRECPSPYFFLQFLGIERTCGFTRLPPLV